MITVEKKGSAGFRQSQSLPEMTIAMADKHKYISFFFCMPVSIPVHCCQPSSLLLFIVRKAYGSGSLSLSHSTWVSNERSISILFPHWLDEQVKSYRFLGSQQLHKNFCHIIL
jgi:hypothetical protein